MCNHTLIEKMIQEYLNSLKETKEPSILSSATLNKITEITNQYFADNSIYIKHPYPVIPKKYYLPPRGNNKSLIYQLLYFYSIYKSYTNSFNGFKYFICTFSHEYKYSDLKMEMENYYIATIAERMITPIFNLHSQNSNSIQRNNKCKDSNMKALEIINRSNLNNKSKKFHK